MKRPHRYNKHGRGSKAFRTPVQRRLDTLYYRSAISDILQATAKSPLDLQPLFDTIASNAARLCRATIAVIRLREEQGFRLVSHTGGDFSSIPTFLPPDFVFHADLTTGTPVQTRDVQRDDRFLRGDPKVVNAAKVAGIRTTLSVPMLDEEEIIGFIFLARTKVQPFTAKQSELVTAFAAQATIALANARRDREFRDLQMAMARAHRITTTDHLTASIIHEVDQPLAATVTNAETALLLLDSEPANLRKLREIVTDIVNDVTRAGRIIETIRGLINKAPVQRYTFDLNAAIREVIVVTRGEAMQNGVLVQTRLSNYLPDIKGDKVLLQQVVLNLVTNSIQAMSNFVDGLRELHIRACSGSVESEGFPRAR
jgi:signal transduction histidine kinase